MRLDVLEQKKVDLTPFREDDARLQQKIGVHDGSMTIASPCVATRGNLSRYLLLTFSYPPGHALIDIPVQPPLFYLLHKLPIMLIAQLI